jgi:hypothetical protein
VGYSLWATLVWISVRAGTVAIPLRARELGALHAS